ncbi:MAG: hypothetical protein Q8P67_15195 [archaeon]|nr:hypothetical protein [archaeon]
MGGGTWGKGQEEEERKERRKKKEERRRKKKKENRMPEKAIPRESIDWRNPNPVQSGKILGKK